MYMVEGNIAVKRIWKLKSRVGMTSQGGKHKQKIEVGFQSPRLELGDLVVRIIVTKMIKLMALCLRNLQVSCAEVLNPIIIQVTGYVSVVERRDP